MRYDVIVAGAGPVGLFLACELRLGGASVLVLEKAADPASPLKGLPFGLRGLWAPTLEAFYRRGWLEEIAPALDANTHWRQQTGKRRAAGHFAGIQFFDDKVDETQWPYRLPGPVGYGLAVSMQEIETALTALALAMGVEIRRGAGVEGFTQNDDGVAVTAGGETYSSGWLVGCDGARSVVRKAAGIDFVGGDPEFTGYSVLVELADPDALPVGRHCTAGGMYSFARPGVIAMAQFDGGAFDRTQPITREHAQAVLRSVSGVEVGVTAVLQAAAWTDRARQASAYRKGRVLLAGDAAHIHSPLGGQGLNLGLGDAMNLGWKLAAQVRGAAPAGLLDSYFHERHPVGAKVLDWSRAQVALMRPDAGAAALRQIVGDLMETGDGATYFARRMWNVSQRYDLDDAHPVVGRSAPDFALIDGTRLGEHLRGGRGLLLDFAGHASLQALAEAHDLPYLAIDAEDRLGLSALMIRPDGVVAWASEDQADLAAAGRAIARWFCGPARGLFVGA